MSGTPYSVLKSASTASLLHRSAFMQMAFLAPFGALGSTMSHRMSLLFTPSVSVLRIINEVEESGLHVRRLGVFQEFSGKL